MLASCKRLAITFLRGGGGGRWSTTRTVSKKSCLPSAPRTASCLVRQLPPALETDRDVHLAAALFPDTNPTTSLSHI
eukprot:SAG11_NODE_20492_length_444_cov_0.820290_1_plen_76_part_10